MHDFSLTDLADDVLLRDFEGLVTHDRETTAKILAHVAEVDARRLYVPKGHSSMFAYCVEGLRMSEGAAYKRIRAARAAREFPVLFHAVADGRLHLAAVSLLATHITAENADELIEAATHRRRSEVEEWLARRFPSADMARAIVRPLVERPVIETVTVSCDSDEGQLALTTFADAALEQSPGTVDGQSQPFGAAGGELGEPAKEGSGPRFLVQVTIDAATHDKLRLAQALLSHTVAPGDVAEVLDRALDALIAQLEKRKLGAGTSRRRRLSNDEGVPPNRGAANEGPPPSRGAANEGPPPNRGAANEGPLPSRGQAARNRYIPSPVRRAVWERDQGQCTFINAAGHRCATRHFLEFDHVEPLARGGKPTVDGLRLRCRAHNQYEAERAFGAEFMSRKRDEASRARREARLARLAAKGQGQGPDGPSSAGGPPAPAGPSSPGGPPAPAGP